MKKHGELFRFDMMVLFGFAGLCTINSYLALHFKDIGFSTSQIGVLYSIYFFLGGLTIPLFLPLLQNTARMQKLMPIFYCGGSIAVLAILIFSKSYAFATLAMITFSIAKGVGFPMFESGIMLFSYSKKIEYANIRLIGSLGFVLFNLVGGTIADTYGFKWIFALGIAFYLLCGILSKLINPTNPTEEPTAQQDAQAEKPQAEKGDMKTLFKNKKFRLFLFGQLFISSLYIATDSFSLLYYSYRGISVTNIGFMTSAVVAVEVVAMLLLARALGKLHGVWGQTLLGIAMLTRCFCYAFDAPIIVIYAMVVVAGLQSGITICNTMKYIRSILGIQHIGSGYILNTMVILLMSGVINISSGYIVDTFSFKTMYLALAVIAAIGMIGIIIGYFAIYGKESGE